METPLGAMPTILHKAAEGADSAGARSVLLMENVPEVRADVVRYRLNAFHAHIGRLLPFFPWESLKTVMSWILLLAALWYFNV